MRCATSSPGYSSVVSALAGMTQRARARRRSARFDRMRRLTRPARDLLDQRRQRLARGVDHVGAHRVAAVVDQVHDEHRAGRALGQDAHLDVARAAVQADDDRVGAVGQVDELLLLRQDFGRRSRDIAQIEHLDLADHQRLGGLGVEAAAGARQAGGETRACHHRRLLDDHRHQHVAAVDHEVGGDAQRQRVGADHVFHHLVGLFQGQAARRRKQLGHGCGLFRCHGRPIGHMLPALAGRKVVETADARGSSHGASVRWSSNQMLGTIRPPGSQTYQVTVRRLARA